MGKHAGLSAGCGSRLDGGGREQVLGLGFAQLGEGVNRRLALAGADDRAMPLVGSVGGIQGLADRTPCASVAVEDEVVLNR